jgi:hypothetical protein
MVNECDFETGTNLLDYRHAPDPGQSAPMMFWAERILFLKEEIADIELEFKRLKNEFDNAERMLFDIMVSQDVNGLKLKGYSIAPTVKTRASIRAEHKESALEWLKNSDYADIVKEQVNAQTLTSLVREWKDNNQEDQVEPFLSMLNLYDDQKISITRGR